MTTPAQYANWLDKCWNEETWTPPWGKAIAGLTAEQAAWKSPGARHSIWMLVLHMSFWRQFKLAELAGAKRDEAAIAAGNWRQPAIITEAAWREAIAELTDLQARLVATIGQSEDAAGLLRNFIEHDAYHIGQIMLIRAMLGLPPLDSFG
jgi:hypothetical protein